MVGRSKLRLYKFLLWKTYVDKGLALMNYPTKALMVVGIGATVQDYPLNNIILFSFIYAFFCLILGRLWLRYRLLDTEQEIMNIFNPFCREVREAINTKNL